LRMLTKILNTGIRIDYLPWEITLTRKLNFLSVIGFFNVLLTLFLFVSFSMEQVLPHFVTILSLAPFILAFNKWFGYLAAAYLFSLMGLYFFFTLTWIYGFDSFIMLYYFPMLISMIQMLGRKETWIHLLVLLVLYFVSMVLLTVLLNYGSLLTLDRDVLDILRPFNVVMSFMLSIIMIAFVTYENYKQENSIVQMLREKEILLAELNHRVKNNMNIVTSLLNLKKNAASNKDVQLALEDCQFRVYSMALVHNQMYADSAIGKLDFKKYIDDLTKNIEQALGGEAFVHVQTDEVDLSLQKAIPCGLIINELLTNAYKHARVTGKQLEIFVTIEKRDDKLHFHVYDNGPGVQTFAQGKPDNSLGFELIRSLWEQLEATFRFANDPGCAVWFEITR
jgi:two-component sensor histidine kinase